LICPNCGKDVEFIDECPDLRIWKHLIYCPKCFWHIRKDGRPYKAVNPPPQDNGECAEGSADSLERMINDIYERTRPGNPRNGY